MPCLAKPQVQCALFLTLASDEFTLVPTRPRADGAVQLGITPAVTVACQTGGRRPGCAKHDHTVRPYGNNVHRDDTESAANTCYHLMRSQGKKKRQSLLTKL